MFGEKIVVDMVPEGQCTHPLLTSACEYLQDAVSTASAAHKVAALSLVSAFLKRSRNDYSDNVAQVMSGLLSLFGDESEAVPGATWQGLSVLMAQLPQESLASHIDWFRTCLRQVNPSESELLGWCVACGLQPVMGMFDYGIRNGPIFGARGRGEADGVADPHERLHRGH